MSKALEAFNKLNMNKLFTALLKEFKEYSLCKLNKESSNYLKNCFKRAFLAGKIEGLETAIKIKSGGE